ncbi:MAG: SUMF1/EgtB/PvdO family nonheme iron enzyme, partial [Fimbriimonas sp.]|nr:SUMF1/EgtB/PvdO family nonheme iron enzyme [Fimbriimonas sp.]
WCEDLYDKGAYKRYRTADLSLPSIGSTSSGARVVRGGSWSFDLNQSFQCAYRSSFDPTSRTYNRGFRCARTP